LLFQSRVLPRNRNRNRIVQRTRDGALDFIDEPNIEGGIATQEWLDWLDGRRLFEPIGNIPPVKPESCTMKHLDSGHAGRTHENGSPEKPG